MKAARKHVVESLLLVRNNTLQTTRDALKVLFSVATEVPSEELLSMRSGWPGAVRDAVRGKGGKASEDEDEDKMDIVRDPESDLEAGAAMAPSMEYLLSLFLAAAYVAEKNYAEAFKVSEEALKRMEQEDTRAFDSIIAAYWTLVRISSNRLGIDVTRSYFRGLAISREFENVETVSVLINCILMSLISSRMFVEAHTFLTNTQWPEKSDVCQSAVYCYQAALLRLTAGEYQMAKHAINLAMVKSTDVLFTRRCEKVLVLVSLHMGVHPRREFFRSKEPLVPYQRLVLVVKSCSMDLFADACSRHREVFERDGLWQVVRRLRPCVLREHVRKIGVVYSRISISDTSGMLGVGAESAVFLLKKAIDDGIVKGRIDPDAGVYVSVSDQKTSDLKTIPRIEEMLFISNQLAMMKKHEPIKRKTIEEMKVDMSYDEYQI